MYCKHCGNQITGNGNFCGVCGNKVDFAPNNSYVNTPVNTMPMNGMPQNGMPMNGMQPNSMMNYDMNKPKKGKGKVILFIVLAIILIAVVVVILFMPKLTPQLLAQNTCENIANYKMDDVFEDMHPAILREERDAIKSTMENFNSILQSQNYEFEECVLADEYSYLKEPALEELAENFEKYYGENIKFEEVRMYELEMKGKANGEPLSKQQEVTVAKKDGTWYIISFSVK